MPPTIFVIDDEEDDDVTDEVEVDVDIEVIDAEQIVLISKY